MLLKCSWFVCCKVQHPNYPEFVQADRKETTAFPLCMVLTADISIKPKLCRASLTSQLCSAMVADYISNSLDIKSWADRLQLEYSWEAQKRKRQYVGDRHYETMHDHWPQYDSQAECKYKLITRFILSKKEERFQLFQFTIPHMVNKFGWDISFSCALLMPSHLLLYAKYPE